MRPIVIFAAMLLPCGAQAGFWDTIKQGMFHTLEVVLEAPGAGNGAAATPDRPTSSRGRVGGFLGQAVEYTSRPKLDEFAQRPVVGRKREINEMVKMMTSSRKRNILIIGKSGVGKTALVEGLAVAFQKLGIKKRIFSITPLQLIESAFYRGSMEGRLQRLYKQAAGIPGSIIFFDEIHGLINLGSISSHERGNDASNLLKPLLLATDTITIGATTWDEFRLHFNDQAFRRRFNLLFLDPPEGELLFEILATVTNPENGYIALENQVDFDITALEEAILQGQDIILENSPDRELDLLTNAAQHKELDLDSPKANQLARERRATEREITKLAEVGGAYARHRLPGLEAKRDSLLQAEEQEVERWHALREIQKQYRDLSSQIRQNGMAAAQVASARRKIEQLSLQFEHLWPGQKLGVVTAADVRQAKLRRAMGPRRVSGLMSEGTERQEEMENKLSEKVWGQPRAVRQVARGHTHYLQGLGVSDKRVAAVYAFCGRSGSGLTTLANALEEIAYGSHQPAFELNLDGSSDPVSLLARFTPPLDPLFIELQKDPYRTVVIKNITKASDSTIRQLALALRAGRAETHDKKPVDLRHVSFIVELPELAGADGDLVAGETLKTQLGAELDASSLDALSDLMEGAILVPFTPHTSESLQRILDDPLHKLNDRLNPRTAGVWIEMSPEARVFLAARALSLDPENPAKALMREFDLRVKEPVSQMSDHQNFKRGDVLDVVVAEDGLKLKPRTDLCSELIQTEEK